MSTYEPYQQRVVDEKIALDEKLGRLRAFARSATFGELDLDDCALLNRQAEAMALYSWILGQRIALFDRCTSA